jgi:hypothetical protein
VKETVNKDTYQTLKEIKVSSDPSIKAITPMWKNNSNQVKLKDDVPLYLCLLQHLYIVNVQYITLKLY